MTENYDRITLNDRTLVTVSGPDAAHFLQTVVTTDVDHIGDGDMFPGALLSPQGKVLFDFLIGQQDKSFFIDIRSETAAAFIKRLSLYRLRANIEIHKDNHTVAYIFLRKPALPVEKKSENSDNMLVFNDKRIIKKDSIIRMYNIKEFFQPSVNYRQKWDIIRIENGIAESGTDFELGDVFPHNINYDQINGLSFKKGCYIGQEVISRMQHRSTTRRRILVATGTAPLPPAGTIIEADSKPIGTLGTVASTKAIALVRIDRIKAMMDAGSPITANGIPLTFSIPANAHFSLSGQKTGEVKG